MIETNIVLCILLWAFFGLQHSLLARPSTKLWIVNLLGVTFEKYFYPIIYFISQCIVFLAIYDTIRHLSPQVIIYALPENSLGFVFWLNRLSNLFLILTVFHFNLGTFTGVTQFFDYFSRHKFRDTLNCEPTTLNTKYLYKYIRHPMYLGIILVFITSVTIYTELFFVNLICIVFYIELGSYFEEKSLYRKFGDQYSEYVKTTKKYFPLLR